MAASAWCQRTLDGVRGGFARVTLGYRKCGSVLAIIDKPCELYEDAPFRSVTALGFGVLWAIPEDEVGEYSDSSIPAINLPEDTVCEDEIQDAGRNLDACRFIFLLS